MRYRAAFSLWLAVLFALSLSVACGSGRGEPECEPQSSLPFSGDWQPVAPDGAALCLNQARHDHVVGTHSGSLAAGIVNRDGTLYLAVENFPASLRVLTLAGDTLTQSAFVSPDGQRTQPLHWVRVP